MANNYIQIGVAVLLVVLLTMLLDPFMVLMPASIALLCVILAATLVVAFAGFVLMERARDEREENHRLKAGRFAYLAGLAVLTTGLVVEGLDGHSNIWIIGAIAVMILAKLGARMWTDTTN